MYGAFSSSKCPFKLHGAVKCIFYFLCLFTSLPIFYTFCLWFSVVQSKSAVNRQAGKWTFTETECDRSRIQETRLVLSPVGVGGGRRRAWICCRGRMRTVSLRASMSAVRSTALMEEDGSRENLEGGEV